MTNEIEQKQPETTQPEQEFTFVFKLSEINLVLAALEELPHKVSRKLIDNIFTQAQTQVKPTETK